MRMKRMLLLPFLGMFLLLALPAQSRQSPEIPAGFPRPQELSFAKGKKHPVFTGPEKAISAPARERERYPPMIGYRYSERKTDGC